MQQTGRANSAQRKGVQGGRVQSWVCCSDPKRPNPTAGGKGTGQQVRSIAEMKKPTEVGLCLIFLLGGAWVVFCFSVYRFSLRPAACTVFQQY